MLLLPLTARWAYVYEVLAIVGLALLGISHFAAVAWLKPVGATLILPMALWLVVMFVFVAPIVLAVQWFTRRSRR